MRKIPDQLATDIRKYLSRQRPPYNDKERIEALISKIGDWYYFALQFDQRASSEDKRAVGRSLRRLASKARSLLSEIGNTETRTLGFVDLRMEDTRALREVHAKESTSTSRLSRFEASMFYPENQLFKARKELQLLLEAAEELAEERKNPRGGPQWGNDTLRMCVGSVMCIWIELFDRQHIPDSETGPFIEMINKFLRAVDPGLSIDRRAIRSIGRVYVRK